MRLALIIALASLAACRAAPEPRKKTAAPARVAAKTAPANTTNTTKTTKTAGKASPSKSAAIETRTGTGTGTGTGQTEAPSTNEAPEQLEAIEAAVRGSDKPIEAQCADLSRSTQQHDERLIWPTDGVVVSAFGKRNGAPHDGIDIAAPLGTPIWAARDGVVLYTGEQPGYGQIVILRHDDDVVTIYAHNAKNCVSDGAKVSQGDVIAVVGESGDATSPGVHFEVRVGNKTVNPRAHLAEGSRRDR